MTTSPSPTPPRAGRSPAATVLAGEGCQSTEIDLAICATPPDLALPVLTGNGGGDRIKVDLSVPASTTVRINGGPAAGLPMVSAT